MCLTDVNDMVINSGRKPVWYYDYMYENMFDNIQVLSLIGDIDMVSNSVETIHYIWQHVW